MTENRTQLPWFVEQMEQHDSELYRLAAESAATAMDAGVLDHKTKCLIVLALDTLKGAEQGVRTVAGQARDAGASQAEIAEAIRLAYFVSGMDIVKTALNAFAKGR